MKHEQSHILTSRPARMARALIAYADLTIPINPLEAATLLGIEVAYMPFSRGLKGMLVCDRRPASAGASLPLILLNSILSSDSRRMRFTLAHELGHYMLHSNLFVHHLRNHERGPQEQEANEFAIELLIPYRDLTAIAHRLPLATLVEYFAVSDDIMEQRLRDTGLTGLKRQA